MKNNKHGDIEKFLFFWAYIIYAKYVYGSSFRKIEDR